MHGLADVATTLLSWGKLYKGGELTPLDEAAASFAFLFKTRYAMFFSRERLGSLNLLHLTAFLKCLGDRFAKIQLQSSS